VLFPILTFDSYDGVRTHGVGGGIGGDLAHLEIGDICLQAPSDARGDTSVKLQSEAVLSFRGARGMRRHIFGTLAVYNYLIPPSERF
jgi:hypothetical protein